MLWARPCLGLVRVAATRRGLASSADTLSAAQAELLQQSTRLIFDESKFQGSRLRSESLLCLEEELRGLLGADATMAYPQFVPEDRDVPALEPVPVPLATRPLSEIVDTMSTRECNYDNVQVDVLSLQLTDEQRGRITSALAVFDEPEPTVDSDSGSYLNSPDLSPLQKQRILETLAVEKQVLEYRHNKKELERLGLAANLSPAQRVVLKWLEPMALELQSRLDDKLSSSFTQRFSELLSRIDIDQVAVLVIHETLSATLKAASRGVPFTSLADAVGTAIVAQIHLNELRESKAQYLRYPDNARLTTTTRGVETLARRCGLSAVDKSERVELGAWLLRVLMDTAFVPRLDPVSCLDDDDNDNDNDDDVDNNASSADDKKRTKKKKTKKNEEHQQQQHDEDSTSGDEDIDEATQERLAALASTQRQGLPDTASELYLRMFGDHKPNAVLEPAFEHRLETKGKHKVRLLGMVRCQPSLYSYVEEGHSRIEPLNTRHQPMLIPPLNWLAPDLGCYLLTTKMPGRVHVMRTKSAVQRPPLYDPAMQMSTTYKALDILSSLPWKINTDILRIQEEAWAEGGGVAEIPSTKEIALPEPLSAEQQQDVQLMRQWRRDYKKKLQLNYDAHGLRCCFRYQLQVAQDFRNAPAIYFPHNVDFRGRAYPIPPHLNHMGADVCRGLLVFAEAKPLGPRGLDWLRIHLCNLFGNNKLSFADRLDFVRRNMDEVYDSATRPLAGRRWWTRAEEPWQALAACIDIVRALESGQPEHYMSHLPVHADGSCNGLQHYAALGGDTFGAKQVNLFPAERPMDVYSGVADLVAQRVKQDAADPTSAHHHLALLLDGKIQRRTIKQTVMTKVYGVTRPGARLQIENAMEDLGTLPDDLPDRDNLLWKSSNYLAALTFDALKSMFSGATTIMDWLKSCAGAVASRHEPVSWVSPIGLPIIQHYTRPSRRRIKTIVQAINLADEGNHISVRRQRAAFPPNYVHSLDSSHMLFTALRMHDAGLPFASVHDSYWTHACNVDIMSRLLREEFVRLHSQPLLYNLHAHLHAVHPSIKLPPVPPRGDFDLRHVLESPYFFH